MRDLSERYNLSVLLGRVLGNGFTGLQPIREAQEDCDSSGYEVHGISLRVYSTKYPWALQRLGLEYEHQRSGMRNRVERFIRYLKERTMVFHNKLSARNYEQGIRNLNLILNLFTLYHQTIRNGGR